MPPEELDAPAEWLAAAAEHLQVAQTAGIPNRLRCFHGQRAAELAIKGLLLAEGVRFPLTHALQELIALVPGEAPSQIREAAALTPYAVDEMYPDTYTTISDDDASDAARLAGIVVGWASDRCTRRPRSPRTSAPMGG